MMYARCLMMLGRLSQACTLLEAAVRDRVELSEGEGGGGIEVLNLGRAYAELGRYADALRLLEPSHARLAERGDASVCAATAVAMARVHVHLGQTARALALLDAVPADAPFHVQAARSWTRAGLALTDPGERIRQLDDALAQFRRVTDLPFARLPIEFDRSACEPGPAAVAALRAGVGECERRELPAAQMLGRMRLVQVLCRLRDFGTAMVVARSLLDDLARCEPVAAYRPELYAACRDAAAGAGDAALARQCQDAAVRWIAATSHRQVPPPFRDSFAHRNPVNRAVLTATLGAPR
jgi:hypothetical protein